MNEKCGSKQTNFERTLISNDIKLRKQIVIVLQSESKKSKIKIVFRTRPKKAQEVTF